MRAPPGFVEWVETPEKAAPYEVKVPLYPQGLWHMLQPLPVTHEVEDSELRGELGYVV